MNRQLSRAFGGKLKIWWVTHRHQVWYATGLVFVAIAFGIVGHYDYQDELELERMKNQRLANCEQRVATESFPKLMFLIEAETPQQASGKLLAAAARMDATRYTLQYGNKQSPQ